jgi:hypothetical protein
MRSGKYVQVMHATCQGAVGAEELRWRLFRTSNRATFMCTHVPPFFWRVVKPFSVVFFLFHFYQKTVFLFLL